MNSHESYWQALRCPKVIGRAMALTFLLLFVGILASSSFGKQRPPPTDAVTRAQIIVQARALVAQQQQQLDDAKKELVEAQTIIIPQLHADLNKAQEQVNVVAQERENWRQYGEAEHDKFMNAEKRVAEDKAGLLRRDIIISGLISLMGAYAAAKFYFHVPFL